MCSCPRSKSSTTTPSTPRCRAPPIHPVSYLLQKWGDWPDERARLYAMLNEASTAQTVIFSGDRSFCISSKVLSHLIISQSHGRSCPRLLRSEEKVLHLNLNLKSEYDNGTVVGSSRLRRRDSRKHAPLSGPVHLSIFILRI